jgi:hypothetical protein
MIDMKWPWPVGWQMLRKNFNGLSKDLNNRKYE